MPFERLNATLRTLRFRLMLWNLLVLLLTVGLGLLAVRQGVSLALMNELDGLLREDALEIALAVKQSYPHLKPVHEELDRKAEGHAEHGWFVRLCDADGRSLWASAGAPETIPVRLDRAEAPWSAGGHRVFQTRIELPGGSAMVMVVGASLDNLRKDLELLTRMMLLVGGAVLLVVPLGAYWLAGRATQGIGGIIRTAAQMRPGRLGERLPLRGTGDELDLMSVSINGLLDRIAAHVDQHRDFIANAAHELRSPLAAIRGAVELALARARSPEEYAGLLGDIEEECAYLTMLVNQLLILEESDAGQLAARECSARLDGLVRKSVEMFRGVAESRGVTLLLPVNEPARVPGGEHYLRQVVNNLVDNAIKFTPPGGRVEVRLTAAPREGRALLSVADTGAGIAPADIGRIFERFYQGDKARVRDGPRRGNGLGLSICRSVVTALKGSVEVASTPGEGSTFTVTLPLCGDAGPGDP